MQMKRTERMIEKVKPDGHYLQAFGCKTRESSALNLPFGTNQGPVKAISCSESIHDHDQ
jgi:hypothetical protein